MKTTRQVEALDQSEARWSTAVDQFLARMRQAMDETGNTYDSLRAATGISGSHWQRMFNNEKPLRPSNIVALPLDMQIRFEELRAKDLGLLVVRRPKNSDDALAAVIGGVATILGTR